MELHYRPLFRSKLSRFLQYWNKNSVNLSDVVQQGRDSDPLDPLGWQLKRSRNDLRVFAHTLRVSRRVRIAKLNCTDKNFERLLVRDLQKAVVHVESSRPSQCNESACDTGPSHRREEDSAPEHNGDRYQIIEERRPVILKPNFNNARENCLAQLHRRPAAC